MKPGEISMPVMETFKVRVRSYVSLHNLKA